MVDPVGAASLALDLFDKCVQGFILIRTAQNIGKDGQSLLRLLSIQEIRLTLWARRAHLLESRILDERLNVRLIEEELGELSRCLTDTTMWKERYGLDVIETSSESQTLESSAVTAAINAIADSQKIPDLPMSDNRRAESLWKARVIKNKNAVLKRLRWASWDMPKFRVFVAQIRDRVDELCHTLGDNLSDELAKDVEQSVSRLVRLEEKIDQLLALSSAAALSSSDNHPASPMSAIGAAAHLKADCQRVSGDDHQEFGSVATYQAPGSDNRIETVARSELVDESKMVCNESLVTANFRGSNVIVEWKELHGSSKENILPRVRNLAYLLNTAQHPAFSIPRCIGLVEEESQVGFIFEKPPGSEMLQPRSLLECFENKYELPSASTRLQLALKVIKIVQLFHIAKWWHKDLRSENILFFPRDAGMAWSFDPLAFEDLFSHPYLVGFSFAREATPGAISEQPSKNASQDIYRHPEALGQPSLKFNEDKDNYALGMVLIEIAEWKPLHLILKNYKIIDTKKDVRLTQMSRIQSRLWEGGKGTVAQSVAFRLGYSYLNLVMLCLQAPSRFVPSHLDKRSDLSQQDMFDEAVRELEKCRF